MMSDVMKVETQGRLCTLQSCTWLKCVCGCGGGQYLLLDRDSSFGVKLQLQPGVSVWSRVHRHTHNQQLVNVSNRHTGVLTFHGYL